MVVLRVRRLHSLILGFGAMAAAAISVAAIQRPSEKPHTHQPVEITGEPILKRIPVSVQRPRSVVADAKGNLYYLDSATGSLVRIDSNGKETLLAKGLGDPQGLCLDDQKNCCVTDFASGSTGIGRVLRITPDGKLTVLAEKLNGPKGIASARDGRLFVALQNDNRIITIDRAGKVREFAKDITTPTALCLDHDGHVLVTTSRDGAVVRISPAGQKSTIYRGLKSPTEIAISPEGDIVVANFAGKSLTRVQLNGKTDDYLKVPQATIAFCFDHEGNMVVVNWDLKLVIHVRNQLLIPCPHCHKKIRVRIKPPAGAKTRKTI